MKLKREIFVSSVTNPLTECKKQYATKMAVFWDAAQCNLIDAHYVSKAPHHQMG
jgi:hypothetical protein